MVRAIFSGAVECPVAEVDGRALQLSQRALATQETLETSETSETSNSVEAPSEIQIYDRQNKNPAFQPAFPVTSCELAVPARQVKSIRVEQRSLPVPKPKAQRLVVLGDTGCRVKIAANGKGDPLQDCADPAAWPWRKLAAAAAKTRPDVVIHLGDFHYREFCRDPVACQSLENSAIPIGYGWAAWDADFFAPAAPLLAAAPWVMLRGNHENCDRAGEGWMRFLSPLPYEACPDQKYRTASRSVLSNNLTAEAYRINLGSLNLLVADNAGHEDYRATSALSEDGLVFERTLATLWNPELLTAVSSENPLWLLAHRPIWYDLLNPQTAPNAFQSSLKNGRLDAVQLAFSGHQHGFATYNFGNGPATKASNDEASRRPAQIVVGGGGTQRESLDPESPFYEGLRGPGSLERRKPDGRLYDGLRARSGILLNRYSFLVLDRAGAGWDGQVLDTDGKIITRCRIDDGQKAMHCAFPEF